MKKVLLVLAGFAALQWFGRTSGTRRAERGRVLPGDEVVSDPTVVTNHALTIDAPPSDVWPWLQQMGWHRGGWYTPRWVDSLMFPGNWPSAEHLDPELVQRLEPGTHIPDGPPGTAEFLVHDAEKPHHLVLHSTTHIPVTWRERTGAAIDWVWTFDLRELPSARPGGRVRTRLLLRTRSRTSPWWLTAAYNGLLVPADLVMAPAMLRGIRRRAQRMAPARAAASLTGDAEGNQP
jgi:hypothetical protein